MLTTKHGFRHYKLSLSLRCSISVYPAPRQRQCIGHISTKQSSPTQVIFSGIQPTGIPHLGNYLGALRKWVQLQDQAAPDTKLLFSIVDLHALTVAPDHVQLRRWRVETLAALLAVGLNPERCTIFFQSDVCDALGDRDWCVAGTKS